MTEQDRTVLMFTIGKYFFDNAIDKYTDLIAIFGVSESFVRRSIDIYFETLQKYKRLAELTDRPDCGYLVRQSKMNDE